jgi:Tol biopolymer transport system component
MFIAGREHRAQALVAIDGNLYVTNLDGSGKRRIGLTYPCFNPAVTPDGGWAVCPNETDESDDYDELQVTSLRPNASSDVQVVHLQHGGFYVYPTWSPDGRELAIVHDRDNSGGTCAIGIYTARPPYATFTHLAEVTSQAFNYPGCALATLSWSPDGKNLAMKMGGVALLPIQTVLAGVPLGHSTAPTLDVPLTAFTVVAPRGFFPAWNPQTGMLTYVDSIESYGLSPPPQRILSYDPKTQISSILLTVPAVTRTTPGTEQVDWLAWTPDGRQLLFVVNEYGFCTDCSNTAPSDVYAFTPRPAGFPVQSTAAHAALSWMPTEVGAYRAKKRCTSMATKTPSMTMPTTASMPAIKERGLSSPN